MEQQLFLDKREDLKESLEAFVIKTKDDYALYVCDEMNDAELTAWSWALYPHNPERLYYVEYWDRKSLQDSFKLLGKRKIDGFAIADKYPDKLWKLCNFCAYRGGFPIELIFRDDRFDFELAPGRSSEDSE